MGTTLSIFGGGGGGGGGGGTPPVPTISAPPGTGTGNLPAASAAGPTIPPDFQLPTGWTMAGMGAGQYVQDPTGSITYLANIPQGAETMLTTSGYWGQAPTAGAASANPAAVNPASTPMPSTSILGAPPVPQQNLLGSSGAGKTLLGA